MLYPYGGELPRFLTATIDAEYDRNESRPKPWHVQQIRAWGFSNSPRRRWDWWLPLSKSMVVRLRQMMHGIMISFYHFGPEPHSVSVRFASGCLYPDNSLSIRLVTSCMRMVYRERSRWCMRATSAILPHSAIMDLTSPIKVWWAITLTYA